MLEQRKGRWLVTIASLVIAGMLGWVGADYFPVQRFFTRKTESLSGFTIRRIGVPPLPTPLGHPYFRYSVIPGGAHSRQELEKQLAGDKVAANHYSDFRVENTRIVTLDRDRQFYVSYRIGDKIYWTRRALTLHKGEKLLFDGVHYARARCGNRLAAVQTMPVQVAQVEPDPKSFTAPATVEMSFTMQVPKLEPAPYLRLEISVDRIVGLPDGLPPCCLDAPPIERYPSDPGPPFADLAGTSSMTPTDFPTETLSAGAPEPGTIGLVSLACIGMAAGALIENRRRRRSKI